MSLFIPVLRQYRAPVDFRARPSWLFAVLTMLATLAMPADAHRLRPAVISADFGGAGQLSLRVSANFEQLMAGIAPVHADTDDAPEAARYTQLRAMSAEQLEAALQAFLPNYMQRLELRFDGVRAKLQAGDISIPDAVPGAQARISEIVLLARVPADASNFDWRYPAEFGDSVLRISIGGGEPQASAWLQGGTRSEAFGIGAELRARPWHELVWEYLVIGFTHIVPLGLDHVLFVLGMFLLSVRFKPLLLQVTAFTVAHTVTLALAMFEVVSLSPDIVEPLIALSIVYIAVENTIAREVTPGRVVVVFIIGLLHGLGFAGILSEVGLPAGEVVSALIAFNVGVEGGQLFVILVAYCAGFFWLRRQSWYRARVLLPASAAIGLVGLMWTVERIM